MREQCRRAVRVELASYFECNWNRRGRQEKTAVSNQFSSRRTAAGAGNGVTPMPQRTIPHRIGVGGLLAAGVVFAIGGGTGSAKPAPAAADPSRLPISLRWSQVPLRDGIERLGRLQGVTVMLDRRVDPSQPVDLTLDNVPFADALGQIAHRQRIGASHLGPVAYLGPPSAARRLRTLAVLRRRDVQTLPRGAQVRLLRPVALRWNDLATPVSILERLSAASGLTIDRRDLVPHDLWPAAELPAQAFINQLTLIGNEFDLSFKVRPGGRSVQLVPIDAPVVIQRSYDLGSKSRFEQGDLARQLPGMKLQLSGNRLLARGRVEQHEALETLFAAGPQAKRAESKAAGRRAGAEQRHTLTVKNQPLIRVLDHLAGQLDLRLRYDRAAIRRAGRSLDVRVSVEVYSATLDELLESLLAPAGLDFRQDGQTVEIRMKDEK